MDIFNFFWGRTWFSEDRISTLSAILFAALGLLAAVIGYQADYTDDIAEVWTGRATQQTMQIASTLATGQFDANYGWSQAYRTWLDTHLKAYLAHLAGDVPLKDTYKAVRDNLTQLSPLLQEPYFGPDITQPPNLLRYEADIYLVQVTRLQQEFEFTQMLSDYWGSVSSDYWLLLKILSTALVLLGLMISLIEEKRIQYAMWTVVLIIGLYCTLQMGLISQRPIPTRDPAAMDKVAEGYGLYYQGRFEEAIAAFDTALELEPDYAEAHVRRGFAYRNFYDEQPSDDKLAIAIRDFEAAIAEGRQEINVIGQLGELYYLTGQFDEGIRVIGQAWEDSGAYVYAFDLGRTYLTKGDVDQAAAYYDLGVAAAQTAYDDARAGNIVGLEALWRSLDIAAMDLDDLLRCAATQFCLETPPYKLLPDAEAIKTHAPDIAKRIKELSIGLEFELPEDTRPVGTITPLHLDADPNFTIEKNVFQEGLLELNGSFDYDNLPDHSVVIVKFYVDAVELPALRQITTIEKGGKGTYSFTINPSIVLGEYRVYVFVNGSLVDQPSFTVLTEGK